MTAEKDVQVARKKGRGGGGEVIWAMPERKHSFLNEVFPNIVCGLDLNKARVQKKERNKSGTDYVLGLGLLKLI